MEIFLILSSHLANNMFEVNINNQGITTRGLKKKAKLDKKGRKYSFN